MRLKKIFTVMAALTLMVPSAVGTVNASADRNLNSSEMVDSIKIENSSLSWGQKTSVEVMISEKAGNKLQPGDTFELTLPEGVMAFNNTIDLNGFGTAVVDKATGKVTVTFNDKIAAKEHFTGGFNFEIKHNKQMAEGTSETLPLDLGTGKGNPLLTLNGPAARPDGEGEGELVPMPDADFGYKYGDIDEDNPNKMNWGIVMNHPTYFKLSEDVTVTDTVGAGHKLDASTITLEGQTLDQLKASGMVKEATVTEQGFTLRIAKEFFVDQNNGKARAVSIRYSTLMPEGTKQKKFENNFEGTATPEGQAAKKFSGSATVTKNSAGFGDGDEAELPKEEQGKEEEVEVPEEETTEDIKPEDEDKVTEGQEPELEKPIEGDKPDVKDPEPNQGKEEEVEVPEEETTEDIKPIDPEEDKATESQEPELEKPIEGDKPNVDVKPGEGKEEEVEVPEEETTEDIKPTDPEEDKATESQEPELEKPIEGDKPNVDVNPGEGKEEEVEVPEEETTEDIKPIDPEEVTPSEEPELEKPIEGDKPNVDVNPGEGKEEEVEVPEEETTEDIKPIDPESVTPSEEPELEKPIEGDKPKVEVNPGKETEEVLPTEETTEDIKPMEKPEKVTPTEEPKLEDPIKGTQPEVHEAEKQVKPVEPQVPGQPEAGKPEVGNPTTGTPNAGTGNPAKGTGTQKSLPNTGMDKLAWLSGLGMLLLALLAGAALRRKRTA